MKERFGKPFNYFSLGKSWQEGRTFMQSMQTKLRALWREATQSGSLIERTACPICGGAELEPSVIIEQFPYSRCTRSSCGHVFVRRLPSSTFRNDFFSRDREYSSKNYCDADRSNFRKENIGRPKVEHALQWIQGRARDWLDIGCGSGELLAAAKDLGWTVTGLELSFHDAEFGAKHFGVTIHNQTLEEFSRAHPHTRFEAVSLIGVLHCVDDPAAMLSEAAALIRPGGIAMFEVANFDSVTAAAVQSFPQHPTRSTFNPRTTIHQFTTNSASLLCQRAGLDPLSTWYFGADLFEILNQWSFSDERFAGSPVYNALLKLGSELQLIFDRERLSEEIIMVARKPLDPGMHKN